MRELKAPKTARSTYMSKNFVDRFHFYENRADGVKSMKFGTVKVYRESL